MAPAQIVSVTPRSPAHKAGIQPGDCLLAINQHPIVDVLDYKFYSYDPKLQLTLRSATGQERTLRLKKPEGADLGLDFETYLIDQAKSCANRCIFCFIDQMPPGMRDTLYFKDDDTRLSLFTGNYVTLTNLGPKDLDRILNFHVSPINISVHSTNPTLRQAMLNHPKAGDCLAYMQKLAQGNITMNCQIVACPGINDGEELERSLREMASLAPWVNSISVVPVGITKFRENLPLLESYTKKTAGQVLDLVEAFAQHRLDQGDSALAWCSDEFYLLAQRPLPEIDYYEDLPQWENGVGMLCQLQQEFTFALKLLEAQDCRPVHLTLATGLAAAPFLENMMAQAKSRCQELTGQEDFPFIVQVIPIVNHFFGPTIDVAGLVTGGDLLAQLKGETLGEQILIPDCMLRSGEAVFLDDTTLQQVAQDLKRPVLPLPNDGHDLCDALFGLFAPEPPTICRPVSREAHPYNP